MKFNLAHKNIPDLQRFLTELPERIENVATEVGRAMSEQLATEVKRRLGGRGGWIRIYRDSIVFREETGGDHWAVAGINETHPKLFENQATITLLNFDSQTSSDKNNIFPIMANNNPWPIDVIPVLKGSYGAIATVRMYDEGTVETYRAARLQNLSNVVEAIGAAGGQVDESGDGLVMIDKLYADIAFMARRLELGFHGYPRMPHWGPAASKASTQGKQWVSTPEVSRLVQNALEGKEPGQVATMSPALASELASIREASWS